MRSLGKLLWSFVLFANIVSALVKVDKPTWVFDEFVQVWRRRIFRTKRTITTGLPPVWTHSMVLLFSIRAAGVITVTTSVSLTVSIRRFIVFNVLYYRTSRDSVCVRSITQESLVAVIKSWEWICFCRRRRQNIWIAPCRENVCLKRSVWHVLEGSHSFTCHPHVYPQMEWTILLLLPSRSASMQ